MIAGNVSQAVLQKGIEKALQRGRHIDLRLVTETMQAETGHDFLAVNLLQFTTDRGIGQDILDAFRLRPASPLPAIGKHGMAEIENMQLQPASDHRRA